MSKLNCKCGNMVECSGDTVKVTCMNCITKYVSVQETKIKTETLECIKPKTNLPVHKRKKWSRDEDLILIQKSPSSTIRELIEILTGRSGYSIQYRIAKLGIGGMAKQARVGVKLLDWVK